MFKRANPFFALVLACSSVACANDATTGLPTPFIQSMLSAQQKLPILFRSTLFDLLSKTLFSGALYERPHRWYTFKWAELKKEPCFAPQLREKLYRKGWSDATSKEFDRRVARARSPLELLIEHRTVFAPLAKQYQLSFLGTNRHTIAFKMSRFPEYVIKVLRNKCALPFQSISRVFWAHSLKKALALHPDLEHHIIVPELFLLHVKGLQAFVPGDPRMALNDKNYIVVERFVSRVPSVKENRKRFSRISVPLVLALITMITEIGIWDVNETTLFLCADKKEKEYRAFFAHLECPGRGGYTADDFYQRSPKTTERLGRIGLQGLMPLLPERVLQDGRVIVALGTDVVIAELERRAKESAAK